MKTIFFIGIGGIGMSALARYFLHYGHKVGGYDRVRSKISTELEGLGAEIIYEDDPILIPPSFRAPHQVNVVYTPAIHDDNQLRTYYATHGYKQMKRADLLGYVTRTQKALCVAGTHGKTTTSTLLAHLLASSSVGANAFLGGVAQNYGSNMLLNEASDYVVIEADEYDRSFHKLSPAHAIITSTEPDHLDIYGTPEAYRQAFHHFATLVSAEGSLLLHESSMLDISGVGANIFTYGAGANNHYYYSNIIYKEGELYFDWHHPAGVFEGLRLGTPI